MNFAKHVQFKLDKRARSNYNLETQRGHTMSKTVFNREKVDFTKEHMFFGAEQNTQRYDVFKFPVFDKLNQTMLGYFWRPEEVSLQKDRADYLTFRPEQKRIFTSNLKYQILLDSVQGRGPALAFLPFSKVSNITR
jgi:ribonucleotide reductase beta subunit family protein with ferritin-like domain